ncbi:Mph(A) family macrolide 2'-phosphotransferase [Parasphingorhabdus pacifica]
MLREPRRPEVARGIPVEARLLELLRPRLRVELPRWGICSPQLVAYQRLRGVPLATEDPLTLVHHRPGTGTESYFRLLGATIAELHRIPVDEAASIGVEVRDRGSLRAELDVELAEGRAELGIPEDAFARWRRWLDDDRYWSGERRLVHGDLSPNHTLVDAAGALLGILDWADAAVDDPVLDFVAPCVAFGPAGLDCLLSAYALADGRPREHFDGHVARLAEFRYRVSLGVHGLRTGNDAYVAIARSRLDA